MRVVECSVLGRCLSWCLSLVRPRCGPLGSSLPWSRETAGSHYPRFSHVCIALRVSLTDSNVLLLLKRMWKLVCDVLNYTGCSKQRKRRWNIYAKRPEGEGSSGSFNYSNSKTEQTLCFLSAFQQLQALPTHWFLDVNLNWFWDEGHESSFLSGSTVGVANAQGKNIFLKEHPHKEVVSRLTTKHFPQKSY